MAAKNRVELKRYIRFQLEQLTQRNEYHTFEALAFELARARICTNILPATGPVQAGGDQGRDFETFRTHLASTPAPLSAFLGQASGETLVFACTIEKKLRAKILSDLATIFRYGEPADAVYYLAASDLPVAARHSLINYCRQTHGARLEILDGQALSDMLADADIFWIATEFLSVSAEMYPRIEKHEEYDKLRAQWLGTSRHITNAAEFLEVKRALRQATFTSELKVDLGQWLALMRPIASDAGNAFQRRALYEISVGQLRGRGTLDPELGSATAFFDLLPHDALPVELEDASILVSYCHSAIRLKQFSAPTQLVDGWLQKVTDHVDQALDDAQTSNGRYVLLFARGRVELQRFYSNRDEVQLTSCLKWWHLGLDIAERDPFCEVRQFASVFKLLIPVAGRHHLFTSLADRVDEIVAKREGKAAAADQCRDRAVEFAKENQLISAIDQLQRTKEGWFSAESMRGSILAMLSLSQWYGELHLPQAARYYAMAAMFAASRSTDDRLLEYAAHAAFQIAETHFKAGEAMSYLAMLEPAVRFHSGFFVDPEDLGKHTHFSDALTNAGQIHAMISICAPHLRRQADALIDRLHFLPDDIIELLKNVTDEPPWNEYTCENIQNLLEADTGRFLFNDIGSRVVLEWRALGVYWTIQSAASHRLVVEELAAILQIIQVDLAGVDLLIVPSNVSMELTLGKKRHFDLRQLPDNGQLRWVIEVPPKWPRDTSGGGVNLVLTLAAMILHLITGLDDKTFKVEFEKRIRRGLFNRALWIRPPSDFFGQSVELCKVPFDLSKLEPPSESRQPVPREAPELAWRSEKAPTYSVENARRNLRSRYRRLTPFLRSVAPKLMADSRTNGLLKKLHESGMLDWQIMSLILNIALQARVNRFAESAPRSPGELKAFYLKQLRQLGEADAADFDPNSLTDETIDLQAKMLTMAASNTWKIVNHRQTPDFAAMKRLLDERFGHSTDDIAHEDVFGWSSVDKTSNL